MKKVLYGTTALVAAGLISSAATAQTGNAIDLSVGGKFEGFVGVAGNQDYNAGANAGNRADRSGTIIDEDAELYFDGETTLDNGLTVGVAMDLAVSDDEGVACNASAGMPQPTGRQTVTQGTCNQDEAYAYVSGGFGEVQAGTVQAVTGNFAVAPYSQTAGYGEGHDKMYVTPPTQRLGSNVNGNNMIPAANISNNGLNNGFYASSIYTNTSDDATVSYMTPSLAGFQVGLSYSPQPGAGKGAATDQNASNHDRLDFAATYSGSMSGVDLAADIGYTTTSRSNNASTTTANGNTYNTSDDPTVWQGGLSVGYANFTLAGRYLDRDFENTGQWRNDGNTWIVGGTYAMGPYEVGLNYIEGTAEGMNPRTVQGAQAWDQDEDELTEWELRGAYTLGPGVTMQASAFHVDYEGELSNNGGNVGQNDDGDGAGLVGGLVLGF